MPAKGRTMPTTSEIIAGYAGPLFMAVAIAILVNRATITALLRESLNSPGIVMFSGFFVLLAGLAIVRAHNIWGADWTILITILGWLLVIGGVVRIIWPERAAAVRRSFLATENGLTAWALVALAIGAFLTAKGYAVL
jgi:hypothetical protein